MATDLAAPTIAYYSRAVLAELLLKAKLGDEWKTYRWFMKPVWLENILTNQPQRWLPSQYANYDALLTAAVETALSQEHAPTALSTWKWGRVHMVDVRHPFWSNFPVLKRATPGPQPLSGDEETIKQVGTHFGPSERFTADMSDLDHSTLDIVNGQSGNIFDEHFNDQWDAYYHGRTFALPFSMQGRAAGRSASPAAGTAIGRKTKTSRGRFTRLPQIANHASAGARKLLFLSPANCAPGFCPCASRQCLCSPRAPAQFRHRPWW